MQAHRIGQTIPQLLLYTIHYGPAKGNRNKVPQKPQALTGAGRSSLCELRAWTEALPRSARSGCCICRAMVSRSHLTTYRIRTEMLGEQALEKGRWHAGRHYGTQKEDDHALRMSSMWTPTSGYFAETGGGRPRRSEERMMGRGDPLGAVRARWPAE
jgi:hypothetical protein